MNEEYDVIVLGTGLKECVLSGLLAVKGKKVLHLDRNDYYGGETASLNLTNLWKKFRQNEEPPKQYGHNRDWNVDLIPKFIMADGKLVKMLLHTKVTKYLEWKCVDASYVVQHKKGGWISSEKMAVCKVPSNDMEALKSNLMGMFEKKRVIDLYKFIENVDMKDPSTWKGFDLNKDPMKEVFKKFKLEENTIDFLGHAVALHFQDNYLFEPAKDTIEKMQLYLESVGRYGESPFLYPIYGLGGLPEAFSRLCAIHGGTYMLNKAVDEITFDADGKVTGIKCGADSAKAPIVICDPSYAPDTKLKPTGKVIRAICLLDHPIPDTGNAQSVQIIIPAKQLGRNSDTYISMVSYSHLICAKGIYVAMVSTTVESSEPKKEIQPALDLLGPILDMFISESTLYDPLDDGSSSGLWISRSYDASSHFEVASNDILEIYEKLSGEKLDLNIQPDEEEEDY
jgi:Rab GDP dissociation inhibitor